MLSVGIGLGTAAFLVGIFRAWRYVERNSRGAGTRRAVGVGGVAWIALAACGTLLIMSSIEALARVKHKEADLIRRKTLVTALDTQLHVYRLGLSQVQRAVSRAKADPTGASAQRLAEDLEQILAEIRARDRNFQ